MMTINSIILFKQMRAFKYHIFATVAFTVFAFMAGMYTAGTFLPLAPVHQQSATSVDMQSYFRKLPIATSMADRNDSRLLMLAQNRLQLEREFESMNSRELEAVTAMLAASGGINGISLEKRELIEKMIARMHALNPESTIGWITNQPIQENRRVFFQTVIGLTAEISPLDALELAESFKLNTGDPVLLPDAFPEKLVELGPDAMLRALALTVGDVEDCALLPSNYPDKFDFIAFADGMTKLASELKESETLPVITADFLAGWLKQDAQAAYDWFVSAPDNQKSVFGGVRGFFEGYANVALPSDYGTFAAQVTLQGDATDDSWADATSILMSNYDSSSLTAFLTEASRLQDSRLVFMKLLEQSSNFTGGDYDAMRRNLFYQAPEDLRAEYLRNAPEHVHAALSASP